MLSRVFRWSAPLGGSRAFSLATLRLGGLASGLLACVFRRFGRRGVGLRGCEESATRDNRKSGLMGGAGSERGYRTERDAPSNKRPQHAGERARSKLEDLRGALFNWSRWILMCHATCDARVGRRARRWRRQIHPSSTSTQTRFPSHNSSLSASKQTRSSSPSRPCSAPSMLADIRSCPRGPTSCPSTMSSCHRLIVSILPLAHHHPRRTPNSPSRRRRVYMRT